MIQDLLLKQFPSGVDVYQLMYNFCILHFVSIHFLLSYKITTSKILLVVVKGKQSRVRGFSFHLLFKVGFSFCAIEMHKYRFITTVFTGHPLYFVSQVLW
jgi:hypothetical protein